MVRIVTNINVAFVQSEFAIPVFDFEDAAGAPSTSAAGPRGFRLTTPGEPQREAYAGRDLDYGPLEVDGFAVSGPVSGTLTGYRAKAGDLFVKIDFEVSAARFARFSQTPSPDDEEAFTPRLMRRADTLIFSNRPVRTRRQAAFGSA